MVVQSSTLLKFIKYQINPVQVLKFKMYIYNILARLTPDLSYCAFIDEHFIQYQGQKKMSKGKPSSKSRIQKGFYRYYLTSPLFGIPLYNVSREANSRLEP
ncbi:MAG: hypothetical protein GF329_20155 [Candidatus Lokiarchaeota archaeon]|nr:hypothetical protein [Candidatus Lokiarchaeota archaeon]